MQIVESGTGVTERAIPSVGRETCDVNMDDGAGRTVARPKTSEEARGIWQDSGNHACAKRHPTIIFRYGIGHDWRRGVEKTALEIDKKKCGFTGRQDNVGQRSGRKRFIIKRTVGGTPITDARINSTHSNSFLEVGSEKLEIAIDQKFTYGASFSLVSSWRER
jgi:hypothetical protein